MSLYTYLTLRHGVNICWTGLSPGAVHYTDTIPFAISKIHDPFLLEALSTFATCEQGFEPPKTCPIRLSCPRRDLTWNFRRVVCRKGPRGGTHQSLLTGPCICLGHTREVVGNLCDTRKSVICRLRPNSLFHCRATSFLAWSCKELFGRYTSRISNLASVASECQDKRTWVM